MDMMVLIAQPVTEYSGLELFPMLSFQVTHIEQKKKQETPLETQKPL